MHSRFTTFLLALMIAMLPLRGWLGDAMAVEMASKHLAVAAQAVATHSVAAGAHSMPTLGDFDNQKTVSKMSGMPCHDMADPAANDVAGTEGAAPQTSNTTCTSCQVCHLSALCVNGITTVAVQVPHSPLAFAPQFWASAELPQATKPPVL